MKKYVSAVFDRKHKVGDTGFGKVEILIVLARYKKKYITVRECTAMEWATYEHSKELRSRVKLYNDIIARMLDNDEELTMENFDAHLGISKVKKDKKEEEARQKLLASDTGFIDFYEAQMVREAGKLAKNTMKRRKTIDLALRAFGLLNSFEGLTPENVRAFDDFLHSDPTRRQQTIYAYHMIVKKYMRMAAQLDYIRKNPYDHPLCVFKKGEGRERKPLTEDELLLLRRMRFGTKKEEHARDLFIFSAYTGLAYSDTQAFDFKRMAVKIGEHYYIKADREKNGHTFFTPILPPAMEVLERYDFQLPKISNQKLNDYLHLIELKAGLQKPMTSHVARHSFATMVLSHDVPIENLARMMGHTNIRTTQVYAKILETTIERHTEDLIASLK